VTITSVGIFYLGGHPAGLGAGGDPDYSKNPANSPARVEPRGPRGAPAYWADS
jgi:hypothetical protein